VVMTNVHEQSRYETVYENDDLLLVWYEWSLYEQMFQLHPIAGSSLSSEFREADPSASPFPHWPRLQVLRPPGLQMILTESFRSLSLDTCSCFYATHT
jgi:hypothetical protein